MDEADVLKTLAHGDTEAIRRILYASEMLGIIERQPLWSILKDYRTPVEFDDLKPIQARRSGPFRIVIVQIPWLYLDPLPYRPVLMMQTEEGLKIIGTVLPFNEYNDTELAQRRNEIVHLSAWWAQWISKRRQPQSVQAGIEFAAPSTAPVKSSRMLYVGIGILTAGLLCFTGAILCMILGFEEVAGDAAVPTSHLARSIMSALSFVLAAIICVFAGGFILITQKRRDSSS